jgi:hypothetical protein
MEPGSGGFRTGLKVTQLERLLAEFFGFGLALLGAFGLPVIPGLAESDIGTTEVDAGDVIVADGLGQGVFAFFDKNLDDANPGIMVENEAIDRSSIFEVEGYITAVVKSQAHSFVQLRAVGGGEGFSFELTASDGGVGFVLLGHVRGGGWW